MNKNNNSLDFNEHSSSVIQPETPTKDTERYTGTLLRESYVRGKMAATSTLDVKNKDRILENLIKVIFDDILDQNSGKIESNPNILKINLQDKEKSIKNTKLSNFVFDAERIAAIIEGYAKVIEQKNS